MAELQRRYHGKIDAASFDNGVWSASNLQDLSAIVPLMTLPKKGKRSAAVQSFKLGRFFGSSD